MKSSLIVLATASLAESIAMQVEKRQGRLGSSSASVCFVWARGSIEPAPMGLQPGPQLQAALKLKFPNLKTFPVNYAAALTTNISPARTDPVSIATAQKAFKEAANSGCQSIVAGGYSQGAAVMHNAVQALDQATKDKIAGVALFGDTRNSQDKGHIKNFPPEKSKVWCNATDGVCTGTLLVGLTHLAYAGDAGPAATWLAERVSVHTKDSSSGSDSGAKTSKAGKTGETGSKLTELLAKLSNKDSTSGSKGSEAGAKASNTGGKTDVGAKLSELLAKYSNKDSGSGSKGSEAGAKASNTGGKTDVGAKLSELLAKYSNKEGGSGSGKASETGAKASNTGGKSDTGAKLAELLAKYGGKSGGADGAAAQQTKGKDGGGSSSDSALLADLAALLAKHGGK